jgi:hypothetical protein
MPFNLLMKRKVFVRVQILCEEYEEKFQEKIATAHVVNVLLAEALIHRGLIPPDFITEAYGSSNPINLGFTARARNDKPVSEQIHEKTEAEKAEQQLRGMLDQWELHPDPEWREKAFAFAEKFADQLQSAKDILKLKKGGSHS